MLRTNLATRPFYNERGVYWVLGLAAVAIALLTVYNVTHVISLTRQQSRLSAEITQDESRAQTLTTQAGRVRATIDQVGLERVIVAAREANAVIDERTFSWTELFNHIERTLPPGVMLTAVQPKVDKGLMTVSMAVVGREVEHVDAFIEKLESTGAFSNVLASAEKVTDDGLFQVTLSGRYQPASGAGSVSEPAEGASAAPEADAPAATAPGQAGTAQSGGGAGAAAVTPPAAGGATPSSGAAGEPAAGTAKPGAATAGKAAPGKGGTPAPPASATPRKTAAAAEAQ